MSNYDLLNNLLKWGFRCGLTEAKVLHWNSDQLTKKCSIKDHFCKVIGTLALILDFSNS